MLAFQFVFKLRDFAGMHKKKQSKTCVTKALQLKVKQLSRAYDKGDRPISQSIQEERQA